MPIAMPSMFAAGFGTLGNVTVHVGADACMDAMARVASGARSRLVGELFGLWDPAVADGVVQAARSTADVRLLVDAENLAAGAFDRVRNQPGVALFPHGDIAMKLHSKAMVADGGHAIISTSTPMAGRRGTGSIDVAFEFHGTAAGVLEQLTLAGISGDANAIRLAAERAAAYGILLGDRASGVLHLGTYVDSLVRGAGASLNIGTKSLTDRRSMKLLAGRSDAQVAVAVSRATSKRKVRRAASMGIDVTRLGKKQPHMHGTVVVADGTEAYGGSAYMSARALGRAKATRPSRELGVAVSGPESIERMEEALRMLDRRLTGSR